MILRSPVLAVSDQGLATLTEALVFAPHDAEEVRVSTDPLFVSVWHRLRP